MDTPKSSLICIQCNNADDQFLSLLSMKLKITRLQICGSELARFDVSSSSFFQDCTIAQLSWVAAAAARTPQRSFVCLLKV